MIYACCDERRRDAVRSQRTINGIDYLEVLDGPRIPIERRQRILYVHFVHPLQDGSLQKENVRIDGGERIRTVTVTRVEIGVDDQSDVLTVHVDKPGDLSTYTLHLVFADKNSKFDPILSEINFTFQVEAPNDFDCQNQRVCPPEPQAIPEINYLAKDFASFRQLMLDRLTELMPQWTEISPADLGITLVELLAYVADYLSYRQDVIATEAYLSTARRRISVRRHALLIDYFIHEGSNARVWVQIQVNANIVKAPNDTSSPLPKGTRLLTQVAQQQATLIPPASLAYNQAISTQPEVFETMQDVDDLFVVHNELHFYTWGSRQCCLPKGATSATLLGHYPYLKPGDILIFQENIGPHTGSQGDSDQNHRCAVRLTNVTLATDPLGGWFTGTTHAPPPKKQEIEEKVEIIEAEETLEEDEFEEEDEDSVGAGEEPGEGEGLVPVRRGGEAHPAEEKPIEEKEDNAGETHITSKLEETGEEDTAKLKATKKPRTRGSSKKVNTTADEGTPHEKTEKPEFFMHQAPDKGRSAKKAPAEDKAHDSEKKEETANTDDVVVQQDTTITVDAEEVKQVEEVIEQKGDATQIDVVKVDEVIEKVEEVVKEEEEEEPDYSLDITEIAWHPDDALPFPLCISTITAPEYGQQYIENVSVALGNIVLADNGMTINSQVFDPVPSITLYRVPASSGDHCQVRQLIPVPPRFQPSLKYTPLTHAAPYDQHNPPASASATMSWTDTDPLPVITLSDLGNPTAAPWLPQRDLLSSDGNAQAFVVEIEVDGTTYLRFGDDQHGLRPQPGTTFSALYRIGNGIEGNIGADSLFHIVSSDARIMRVNNPLPAQGGVEPESVEDVRQHAPAAFRMQERGVMPSDYLDIVERYPDVHRAAAILNWTGSWYTVFLAVDRQGGAPVNAAFIALIRERIERSRMAGYDLEIVGPVYVSLEVEMTVQVKPTSFRQTVADALMDVFSNRVLPGGQRGIFYTDNYTFGQPVYLSALYAAAQAVEGIDSVEITTFQRQGFPSQQGLSDGELVMDWLEIARLDNDPNFPEHGILHLNVEGGK